MITRKLTLIGALSSMLLCASSLLGQTNVGQWDFDSANLTQTSGANLGDMTYYDGPTGATSSNTVFGTTAALGIPNIGGTSAHVMKFAGNLLPQGYLMPTPPANGSGSLVNNYTIIVDVMYPSNNTFRPLIQMDDGTLDHIFAYIGIGANNALIVTNTQGATLPSAFFGNLAPNTWYRLGFVLDTDNGIISVYTNGVQAGILNIGPGQVDSPYALLASSSLPVFTSTITNAPGYVNSLQIRDTVLNPGEMEALGGPTAAGIPITLPPAHSFIASRSPGLNEVGIGPLPLVQIALDQGDSSITPASIVLSFDGAVVPATVGGLSSNEFDITYQISTILDPLSNHSLRLVYTDSISGSRTNNWAFTVANYQNLVLPAPIYFENFDELEEGALPPGWSVTNRTVSQVPGFDLNTPQSDAYLSYVVISSNRLLTVFSDTTTYTSPGLGTASGERRLLHPPIVLNGVLIDSLVHGNLAYCDSDQRQNTGGQVDVMFTSDYNLTGVTNVYLAFDSIYEQNQDNIGSVEYSIDQGVTWLPALYMLDDGTTDGDGSDVVYTNGVIDVTATFGTARNDQAYNLAYSNFIGAAVSTNLIPFIQGRRNDDPLASKRIEVIRLAQADNQPHVRFRFGQAGTSSWYFGIDDFGLYSISTPVISVQPQSQTIEANTPVTFSVTASGHPPLAYQWKFNGLDITNATNSSYTIAAVAPANAGLYTVTVSNSDGPTKSAPAQLTVITTPAFLLDESGFLNADLSGEVADPGATVTLKAQTTGGRPLTHFWYFNGGLIATTTNSSLVLSDVQAASAGNYQLVISNSYGVVNGALATLKVYSGPLSSNLVVHLTFDGNFNDTSGRGNNAAYATNGTASNPNPTFVPGKIGQAFEYTTTIDASVQEYATLGYPADLQFADTNDFSVSFWANYTNQNDDLPFISNKDWDSSSNPGWGIFTQGGGNYRENVTGPNLGADKFSYTDTPHTMKDGNWHHVVVSFQKAPFGQEAYVYGYLDGVLVNKHRMAVTGTIDTFGLPFSNHQGLVSGQTSWAVNIGQDGTGVYHDNGSAYDINAMIDDLGIWRRALTANEVTGIYNAGLAGSDLSQVLTPPILVYSVVGNTLHLSWAANPNLKLQKTTSLTPTAWTDVAGTLGAGSATVPLTGTAFFRVSK